MEARVVPLQPHHRVAAPRPAHRPHAVGVHVGQLRQRGRDRVDVLHHLAAPVARDGRGVGLAVAGRAVRVGERHDVAGARVDLPVAAEGVGPLRLRPAVDVEDERVLLRRVEPVRLDDEDLHRVPVGAGDLDGLLGRADVHLLLDRLVLEASDAAPRRRAARGRAPTGSPMPRRTSAAQPAPGARSKASTVPRSASGVGRDPALQVHGEERHAPLPVGGEDDALRVRGPREVVHPVVERVGEDAHARRWRGRRAPAGSGRTRSRASVCVR